ncbi:MAG TPA: glycosyltransferase [Bryobacteraceae bacterium]|nr:glycosyltransferase [Bryobacteraceae bacterium]
MSGTRLGYLVSRYPGISHTFILREVLELRRQGFEIEVASINPPDRTPEKLTRQEQEEAARTYYVRPAGAAGALGAVLLLAARQPAGFARGLLFALRLGGGDARRILWHLFYFVEAAMLARWMRHRNLRHLHVHFATPASNVALVLTRIAPVSFSITVHGPDEFYDVTAYRLAEKIAGAAFLCTIGTYARSQLMKLAPPGEWLKFEVTPLGVSPAEFSPAPFRESPRPFWLICVGRLVPAKGQHILLAALERLVRNGREVRLRLVGDGPDRESLERTARERGIAEAVVFEGAVNQDRVRALYQAADAFVLASFAEGIPVVLMEAMAMEIPCITTWINGIPELVRDAVDGILVAPSDDEALAEAIARLMDDVGLRRRLGQAGRRRVLERYDLERNTGRLAEVFGRRLGGTV